jgi:hypothetical protein
LGEALPWCCVLLLFRKTALRDAGLGGVSLAEVPRNVLPDYLDGDADIESTNK